MRTKPLIYGTTKIAIKAKKSITVFGPTESFEMKMKPAVSNQSSVLSSIIIDMINAQKSRIGFTAASTFFTIGSNHVQLMVQTSLNSIFSDFFPTLRAGLSFSVRFLAAPWAQASLEPCMIKLDCRSNAILFCPFLVVVMLKTMTTAKNLVRGMGFERFLTIFARTVIGNFWYSKDISLIRNSGAFHRTKTMVIPSIRNEVFSTSLTGFLHRDNLTC